MTRAREQLRELIAAPELLAAASADDLRVGERLRERWPADLVAAASEQAELRTRAGPKFSRAGEMLFTRDGLEQASAEVVGRHRAERFRAISSSSAGAVLDLCCGIGGDLVALADVGAVVGVDRDERHALLARHNAAVYGAEVPVVVADVTDLRIDAAAAVFVDPARRTASASGTRRGGYTPGLDWCLSIPAARVCVKTAPGLDVTDVPESWEAEFVAVGRDLKEAALWSPAWASARGRATVLASTTSAGSTPAATMTADPSTPPAPVRPPGPYVLDPSPAVTRAGAVADLAQTLNAWQIDPRIAFLCTDSPVRSPFARSLVVEASLPFGVKSLAAELRRLDIAAVELRRRGLAGDVTDLARRLRGTGTRTGTVLLTRVVNKPWALVCSDLSPA